MKHPRSKPGKRLGPLHLRGHMHTRTCRLAFFALLLAAPMMAAAEPSTPPAAASPEPAALTPREAVTASYLAVPEIRLELTRSIVADSLFCRALVATVTRSTSAIKSMRAKMYITQVEKFGEPATQERVHFAAVAKKEGYGNDGLDEDNTYAKFSPSGDLHLTIANPALLGVYQPGQKFYLDFTPVTD